MDKKIREFIYITCLSFTLVCMINAVFGIFSFTTIVTPIDTMIMFATCLVISFLIEIGEYIPVVKDYQNIYNYFVVIAVSCGINTLILGHFYWQNVIIQLVLLTLVYLAVGFMIYGVHYKEAMLINKKIDQTRKRNPK